MLASDEPNAPRPLQLFLQHSVIPQHQHKRRKRRFIVERVGSLSLQPLQRCPYMNLFWSMKLEAKVETLGDDL